MKKIAVLGDNVQGLIAAGLLARAGAQVQVFKFNYNETYLPIADTDCKAAPVTHIPFAIPTYLVHQLDLTSFGFEPDQIPPVENPFEKLPFYDGLKSLTQMFIDMEDYRPPYNEKAWRDTWSTFEIGRVLSEYDDRIQSLFAQSATLSLVDLLNATDLDDGDKGKIIAACTLGGKTDPSAKGSAACILPTMMPFVLKNHLVIKGELHNLIKALRDSALSAGAEIITDNTISRCLTNDSKIDTIILNDETEVQADGYILDTDPVTFFKMMMQDVSVPPAFKNRVIPNKNEKDCISVHMVLNASIAGGMIAPSTDYISEAMADMRAEGGSQNPVISIMNISQTAPSLSPDDHYIISVVAQYYEYGLEEENADAITEAVLRVIEKHHDADIRGKVVATSVSPCATQFGQPTFAGTMPLLQLYKVFSGYHSIAYDMPISNATFAGYGSNAVAHYHTYDGGVRVASLYQNIFESDTN